MASPHKHFLLSRKFWLSLSTVLCIILSQKWGIELKPEHIVGIIVPVASYIIGESYIDRHK